MKPKSQKIRITGGKFRGRNILCPPGEIRPMTAMVKEALFNILKENFNMSMLDLFCGSGSISIEGISRGLVGNADLVEGDFNKKPVIQQNLRDLKIECARINIQDVFSYLRRCKESYDFIMADPPFNMPGKGRILKLIIEQKLLNPKGFIILHIPAKDGVKAETIEGLTLYDTRKYGINVLLFYKLTPEPETES